MSLKVFFSLARGLNSIPSNAKSMCYKSALSLDKIYPNSSPDKPFTPPESPDGKFTGYIPIKDLQITYALAGAPGGQNVNKTETKVDIRFHVQTAKWLSESTKQKLMEKYYTRINKDGYFIVRSEKTRSKILNTADAMNYLRKLIYKLEEPEPVKDPITEEKHRKNKEKANRRRLMEKRYNSYLKSLSRD